MAGTSERAKKLKESRERAKEISKTKDRAPTISFVSDSYSSRVISEKLSELGIMSGSGSFYANRLLQELGIPQDDGVVRLSCVHYTSGEDVKAVIQSLEKIL